ncbi:MAG TPA: DNA repair exonuclease [bacterium]|nr:DNA repair exonuclease [bacterium]
MPNIKVVHTADIHLGRRFPNLDRAADRIRTGDIERVFNELTDYVVKNGVNLVLIAGSLFDKRHPNRETVSTALTAFGRIHDVLPNTRIVLTPGQEELVVNKDGEIDCSLSIFNHLSYIDVIGLGHTPETVNLNFDGVQVMVCSSPVTFFFEEDFKTRKIPAPKDKIGIYLLCNYSRRQDLLNVDNELLRERVLAPIRDRGYQYVALGHRHRLELMEAGDFTAIYPGSLERFDFDIDRERKCFITFEIADGKAQPPQTIRTSARQLEYVNLTCSVEDKDIEAAFRDLSRRGNKDKILYIVLNGQLTFDVFNSFQKSELLSKLKEKFAFVNIDSRLMLVDSASDYKFEALHVGSPIEEFRHFMQREIDEAREKGDEVKLLEELLEMGEKEIGELL